MVKIGIDRIDETQISVKFKNKRIGLIAASSGISANYLGSIEEFVKRYNINALFAPEHGIRGVLGPGEKVSNGIDKFSGIKVFSLFEDLTFSSDAVAKENAYKPKDEMLKDIDLIVFDMQDVGSRFFTYSSTLYYTMKACAAYGIPVCVLDRANPIGGTVEGNIQKEEYSSFIGMPGLPIRHGMTMAELARFFNGEFNLCCELDIVTMVGWDRSMYYDDTGLPFIKPSPNLPNMDAITVYNGVCMLAGTNVSEGRGTTSPFTCIGAPYINPFHLAEKMNEYKLDGIKFSPSFFVPQFSKYAGEVLYGVNIHVIDRKKVKPIELGMRLIDTIRHMYPNDFEFISPKTKDDKWHIDLSTGGDDVRTGKVNADDLLCRWQKEADSFMTIYNRYRIYD